MRRAMPNLPAWRAILAALAVAMIAGTTIAPAENLGVTIEFPDAKTHANTTRALGADDIAKLPSVTSEIAYDTGHGMQHATYAGPLLWALLAEAGALAGMDPREQAGHVVIVTGGDGYRAALALGEISPDFEGKSVLLANHRDGKPLGEGHWRLVIPGEHRGGRDVWDVATISLR